MDLPLADADILFIATRQTTVQKETTREAAWHSTCFARHARICRHAATNAHRDDYRP